MILAYHQRGAAVELARRQARQAVAWRTRSRTGWPTEITRCTRNDGPVPWMPVKLVLEDYPLAIGEKWRSGCVVAEHPA